MKITSLQPRFSLVHPEIESEVPGISAIVYSPMASGLFTDSMTRERISKLPDGAAAIVGIRKRQQVDDVITAAAVHLTQSELMEIEFIAELAGRGQ